ncbi:hypothetical protein [Deinococcus sp.]|uniref:hypothetical protein n=1 Tax=Deinococcus sp. TaxID=47478 RepID=UPI003CC6707F
MIAIQVLNAAGAVIGVFGFQSVPRVGEEIHFYGAPNSGHIQRVIHTAGNVVTGNPPAVTQIQLA